MATEYGKRLRAARKHAGLTQAALSKKTGIPQSTISTAEREGHGSSDTPVYAATCKVDPLWLGTGNGEMLTGQASIAITAPSGFIAASGGPSAAKNVASLENALTELGRWALQAGDLERDQVRPLVNRMFDEPQRSAEIIARIVASMHSEITPLDGPNLTPHDKVRAAQVNKAAQMADSFQPFKNAKSKT